MTDGKNIPPLVKITERRAMSVWSVQGSPVTADGLMGAERTSLLLLPMTANVGTAVEQFRKDCELSDDREYASSKASNAFYRGWVWLPLRDDPWSIAADIAAGFAGLEKLSEEIKAEVKS